MSSPIASMFIYKVVRVGRGEGGMGLAYCLILLFSTRYMMYFMPF